MLNLPVKMQNALDMGNFQPVGVLSLTTDVIDAPLSDQTFVDVNSNLDTSSVSKKKNIKQRYPDPTATGTLINKGTDGWQVHMWAQPGAGGVITYGTSFSFIVGYQTFSVGEDIQQAVKLRSISVELTKQISAIGRIKGGTWTDYINVDHLWEARARLYRIEGGTLLGLNGEKGNSAIGLTSPTIHLFSTVSSNFSEHTYDFDVDLLPGVRYALMIYMAMNVGGHVAVIYGRPKLAWNGRAKDQLDGNFSWSVQGQIKGPELTLKADFSTYDSSPLPLLRVLLDLKKVPTNPGVWNILDAAARMIDPVSGANQSTSIAYHAWAGDSLGAKTVDLGAIDTSDPESLKISNSKIAGSLRQFYVLEATFSATLNGLRTHSFISVNAIFASGVGIFSTHPLDFTDGPFLKANRPIPSKIDLTSGITKRGTISFSLIDINGELNRVILNSHLPNLPVEYRVGDAGAESLDDMVLLFAGKITDYGYEEGMIKLKAEDRTVNLSQKIPRRDRTQIQTVKPKRDFSGAKLADVLQHILENEVLVPKKFIDTASINAAQNALPTPSRWVTSRILSELVEADKLVKPLLKLLGSFLVAQENGVLTAIRYPRLDTSVATWDENILSAKDTQPMGLRKTIVNQCFTDYDEYSDGKFLGISSFIDHAAQDDWSPGAELFVADRLIKTKWLGNQQYYSGKFIANAVSKRIVDLHKNGLIPFKGETGIDQFAVQVGDFVDVTSPAFLKKGELGMAGKQFMVTQKTPDFDKGVIKWSLIEVIISESLPTAIITPTSLVEGPPDLSVVVNGSASTANSGTISDYEWDKDFDGENFQIDAIGSSPPAFIYDSTAEGFKVIALRVRNSFGGEDIATLQVRVYAQPVAVIGYKMSAPDQPLTVSLWSDSYSDTAQIANVEWDLSYDGLTFNSEVSGEETALSLPYSEVFIVLRVTDTDGQTVIVTQGFAGKTITPAQTIEFFVDQSTSQLLFTWSKNTEPDIKGYEIRQGAAWNSSVLIASDIQTNHFMSAAPVVPGTYTYRIKAINTSGRKSITDTVAIVIVLDTGDRTVLDTAINPSLLGWMVSGGTTGLVFDVAGNRWWIESTSGHVTQGDTTPSEGDTRVTVLAGVRTEGVFVGPSIDMTQVVRARISINPQFEIVPDPDGTSALVEIRLADAVAWGPFGAAKQADLEFKAYQPRITLKNLDGASNIALTDFSSCIDARDIFDSAEDLTVASSGVTAVTFKRLFSNVGGVFPRPLVKIAINNMTVPIYPRVENITNNGFDLRLFLISNNTQTGGTVDWFAKGI